MDALTHYQAMADELAGPPPYRTVDLSVAEVGNLWHILTMRIDKCLREIDEETRLDIDPSYWEREMATAVRLRDRLA